MPYLKNPFMVHRKPFTIGCLGHARSALSKAGPPEIAWNLIGIEQAWWILAGVRAGPVAVRT